MGIRLLMMDETANRNLMASVFDALKEGNLEPLFAALNPDVMWHMAAPREFFRCGGCHRGIAEMKAYTAMVFSRYHFLRFEPLQILAHGDTVWGHFDVQARHLPTARIVASAFSIRWVVRDRRIVEHHSFFDTAAVLIQQGEMQAA